MNTRTELVEDGLVTIREAGRFLNLSRTAIYGLMESGLLPYVKLGRSRRVPKRALTELAGSCLRGGWKAAPHG